jgi:hypothetical protein
MPWAGSIEWGERVKWKQRLKAVVEMEPVLLWVDDRPNGVRHIQREIQEESRINVCHEVSTRDAIKWLTTQIEALNPVLRVVTDNHRVEEDEHGNEHSNYEAGSQLVRWLYHPENGFDDVKSMIFCGRGSLPYLVDLQKEYKVLSPVLAFSAATSPPAKSPLPTYPPSLLSPFSNLPTVPALPFFHPPRHPPSPCTISSSHFHPLFPSLKTYTRCTRCPTPCHPNSTHSSYPAMS